MLSKAAMRRWLLMGATFSLGLSGCADALIKGRVRELNRQVEELSRRENEHQTQKEEMENRILLLSDQMESQRVAHTRRGAVDLPVVTLRPAEGSPAAPPPAA